VRAPAQGRLGERFKENVPTGYIAAPLLIGQGLSDDLVLPTVQERFVRARQHARCRGGSPFDSPSARYRDHLELDEACLKAFDQAVPDVGRRVRWHCGFPAISVVRPWSSGNGMGHRG
jgi:hypothetical protein